MFELNGYQMPDFPESRYPYAMVSLDSSGGCAYLTFTDKVGYIKKVIVDNVWYGNSYTLGLTADATYDESKVIYEESYVVMLDETYKDALELLYPGINKTSWLRYTPSSKQTPSGGYYSLAMNYGPQWSNVTLYDEDGNLFLSAGKKFPLQGWLNWHVIGLCSRPLPVSVRNKVPVAYLYNGVRLPDINAVWTDKEKYPYAVISDTPGFANSGIGYQLMASSSPTEITSSGTRYFVSNAVVKEYMIFAYNEEFDATLREEAGISLKEYVAMAFGMELDVWTFVTEFDNYEAGFAIDSNPTRWANHDILSEDGTVYLAASDPVPVYE